MSFHILSLNGGGVRGFFQLSICRKLSKHLAPIRERVDLIAGTSTGRDRRPWHRSWCAESKIADLFKNHAAKIFREEGFGAQCPVVCEAISQHRSEPSARH